MAMSMAIVLPHQHVITNTAREDGEVMRRDYRLIRHVGID